MNRLRRELEGVRNALVAEQKANETLKQDAAAKGEKLADALAEVEELRSAAASQAASSTATTTTALKGGTSSSDHAARSLPDAGVAALQQELAQALQDATKSKYELKAAHDQVTSLQEQLRRSHAEHESSLAQAQAALPAISVEQVKPQLPLPLQGDASLQESCHALQAELDALTREHAALQEQTTRLQSALQAESSKTQELQAVLSKASQHGGSTSASRSLGASGSLGASAAPAAGVSGGAEAAAAAAAAALATAHANAERADKVLEEQRAHNTALQQQLDAQTQELSAARQALAAAQAQLQERVVGAEAAAREELRGMGADMDASRTRVAELQAEADAARARADELGSRLDAAEAEIADLHIAGVGSSLSLFLSFSSLGWFTAQKQLSSNLHGPWTTGSIWHIAHRLSNPSIHNGRCMWCVVLLLLEGRGQKGGEGGGRSAADALALAAMQHLALRGRVTDSMRRPVLSGEPGLTAVAAGPALLCVVCTVQGAKDELTAQMGALQGVLDVSRAQVASLQMELANMLEVGRAGGSPMLARPVGATFVGGLAARACCVCTCTAAEHACLQALAGCIWASAAQVLSRRVVAALVCINLLPSAALPLPLANAPPPPSALSTQRKEKSRAGQKRSWPMAHGGAASAAYLPCMHACHACRRRPTCCPCATR